MAATADPGSSLLVPLIVAVASSGVLVAGVQGLFTRRKTRAEVESTGATATKMITDAAAVIVANLQTDNTALRTELATLRAEVARLEAWREATERLFEAHERWDLAVAERIADCSRRHEYPGGGAGPPPPLRPPQEAT